MYALMSDFKMLCCHVSLVPRLEPETMGHVNKAKLQRSLLMDVDLPLGTEQALMLHSVYISYSMYFVVMKLCLVLSLQGGHGGGAHPSSDQRARWQSCRSCACNGSKYVQNSSLTVLVRRSALYVME